MPRNRPSNLVALPKRKHREIMAAKSKRIRQLEYEVKRLTKALEDKQLIFLIQEKTGTEDQQWQ